MALNGLLQRLLYQRFPGVEHPNPLMTGRSVLPRPSVFPPQPDPLPVLDGQTNILNCINQLRILYSESSSYYSIIIILIITAITKLTDLSTIVNVISSSLSFSSK